MILDDGGFLLLFIKQLGEGLHLKSYMSAMLFETLFIVLTRQMVTLDDLTFPFLHFSLDVYF